jgi:Ca2+-binding RTX toxin-like protein
VSVVAASVAAVLAVPQGAGAGQVGYSVPEGFAQVALNFRAAPGERNDVHVADASAGDYVIEDRGAPLTVGDGCVAESPTRARCRHPPRGQPMSVIAFLGDGDDALIYEKGESIAFGGPGDDVLAGGFSYDQLYGEDGDDRIRGRGGPDGLGGDGFTSEPVAGRDDVDGGSGNDRVEGGPGADLVRGGAGSDILDGDFARERFGRRDPPRRARDRIRGGPGEDAIQYQFSTFTGQRAPPAPSLRITFDERHNDGPRGEGDDVASDVEQAYSLTVGGVGRGKNGFRVTRNIFNGRPASGRLGVRFYRLTAGGTPRAQTGLFEGSELVQRTRRRAHGRTEISLIGGRFDRCGDQSTAHAAQRRRGAGRLIRRLLARVRGLFRINARYVSLTVHGTEFSVTERCRQTLVRVKEGAVSVRVRGRPGRTLVRGGGVLRIRTSAP